MLSDAYARPMHAQNFLALAIRQRHAQTNHVSKL